MVRSAMAMGWVTRSLLDCERYLEAKPLFATCRVAASHQEKVVRARAHRDLALVKQIVMQAEDCLDEMIGRVLHQTMQKNSPP